MTSSAGSSKDDRFYTPRQTVRTVGNSSSENESWYSPRGGSVVSESSESDFFGPQKKKKEGRSYRRRNHFFEEDDDEERREGVALNEDVTNIFSFARHNRVADLEALLARGVPPDVRDEYGNTILIIASQNGHKRIVKAALRRGANPNAQNHRGNTSLHFCFSFGYGNSLAVYLRSKGANDTILNYAGLSCYQGIDPSSPISFSP